LKTRPHRTRRKLYENLCDISTPDIGEVRAPPHTDGWPSARAQIFKCVHYVGINFSTRWHDCRRLRHPHSPHTSPLCPMLFRRTWKA